MKCKVVLASSLIAPGVLAALEWFAKVYPATTWFALLMAWVMLMFIPMFVLIFRADKQLEEYKQ